MTESGLTLLVVYHRSIPPLSTGLRYWAKAVRKKQPLTPVRKTEIEAAPEGDFIPLHCD